MAWKKEMAWKYFSNASAATKGITLFYNLLQGKTSFSKLPPMLKWERDLGCSFSDSQWLTALNSNFKVTHSSNLWELTFKYNLRWYITPSQIYIYAPSTSPNCWRICAKSGTLYHILWECNKISPFWEEVFQLITEVIQIHIIPSPEPALLNIGIGNIPYQLINNSILLAARLAIIHHWETPDYIPRSEVISLVHTHCSYLLYMKGVCPLPR